MQSFFNFRPEIAVTLSALRNLSLNDWSVFSNYTRSSFSRWSSMSCSCLWPLISYLRIILFSLISLWPFSFLWGNFFKFFLVCNEHISLNFGSQSLENLSLKLIKSWFPHLDHCIFASTTEVVTCWWEGSAWSRTLMAYQSIKNMTSS